MALSISHRPPPPPKKPLDASLRGYLASNADIVTRISKPVHIDDIGALSAQSDRPILFENIVEKPGFRLCDILVKTRASQARALGVAPEDYLRTLAYRLRQPPRGFKVVKTGPVKEVVKLHNEADWTELPIPFHKDKDAAPYITAMNIIRDPETGFYNSCHAGTHAVGPRRGLVSFVTPHSHVIMRKYREMGRTRCRSPSCSACRPPTRSWPTSPACTWMPGARWRWSAPSWTATSRWCRARRWSSTCRRRPRSWSRAASTSKAGSRSATSPRPRCITCRTTRACRRSRSRRSPCAATGRSTATTRPRPATDHQPLPRLCHEAVLYNRLSEIGLDVKDVRFPTWGAALSCILQFSYPREGMVNDALMTAMGAPWLNTKLVVAVSPDTNLDDPADVYHAIATRCDPARDVIIVSNTRGSPYDPSARPLEGHYPWRTVGKMGIDATIKSRHDPADFERAWPRNWGKVKLEDYL